MLVFATIRMVWLVKLLNGAGPGFAGAAAGAPAATGLAGAAGMLVAIGEAAQVATQCSCPKTEELSNKEEIAPNRRIRVFISPLEYWRVLRAKRLPPARRGKHRFYRKDSSWDRSGGE